MSSRLVVLFDDTFNELRSQENGLGGRCGIFICLMHNIQNRGKSSGFEKARLEDFCAGTLLGPDFFFLLLLLKA